MLITLSVLLIVSWFLFAWWLYQKPDMMQLFRSKNEPLSNSDGNSVLENAIHIIIQNPLAVAAQEKKMGKLAGAVAPKTVTKQVYKIVSQELAQELGDRNIAVKIEAFVDGKRIAINESTANHPIEQD